MGEKISILITNYNSGTSIIESINSVLNQSSNLFDIYIYDNNSSDVSREIIISYAAMYPNIKVFYSKKTLNKSEALSYLIEECNNDIVGILDAGDALTSEAIDKVLHCYSSNPNHEFIYTNFWYCDGDLNEKRKGYCKRLKEGKTALEFDVVSHFKTFRKRLYSRTTGLDLDIDVATDKDLVYRLEEYSNFHFLPECLYLHRGCCRWSGKKDHHEVRRRAYIRRHPKMENDTVSFCITNKNRFAVDHEGVTLDLMGNCIDSILKSVGDFKSEIVISNWGDNYDIEKMLLDQIDNRIPLKVITVDGNKFSRGKGLNIAYKNSVGFNLFFLDTDMIVTPELIERGVNFLSENKVFFPICYSYTDINHTKGYWRHQGWGNVMITREMFESAGKWVEKYSYGREDEYFHSTCKKKRFDIARKRIEGFYHQWHPLAPDSYSGH